jgi:hypothetical protein
VADPFSSLSVRRSTCLFAWSALVVLLLIPVGWLISVPRVDAWLDSATTHLPGQLLIGALLLTLFVSTMLLWISAIWYARVSPDVILPRNLVTAILVVTFFVGAFFYYWFAVHWRSGTKRIVDVMQNPFLPNSAA